MKDIPYNHEYMKVVFYLSSSWYSICIISAIAFVEDEKFKVCNEYKMKENKSHSLPILQNVLLVITWWFLARLLVKIKKKSWLFSQPAFSIALRLEIHIKYMAILWKATNADSYTCDYFF